MLDVFNSNFLECTEKRSKVELPGMKMAAYLTLNSAGLNSQTGELFGWIHLNT